MRFSPPTVEALLRGAGWRVQTDGAAQVLGDFDVVLRCVAPPGGGGGGGWGAHGVRRGVRLALFTPRYFASQNTVLLTTPGMAHATWHPGVASLAGRMVASTGW